MKAVAREDIAAWKWRHVAFAALLGLAPVTGGAVGWLGSSAFANITTTAPALDASRWTGVKGAADPNGLLTGLAIFVQGAAAARHLDDPVTSRVAGTLPRRWSSFALIPDNPSANRVLINLGTLLGFDGAVYPRERHGDRRRHRVGALHERRRHQRLAHRRRLECRHRAPQSRRGAHGLVVG